MRPAGTRALPLLLALAVACSPGARAYQRENRALLDSLPVYPGAREVERHDAVKGEGDRDTGWTVTARYALPPGVTAAARYALPPGVTAAQVLDHYRDRLAGWTSRPDCCGGLPAAAYRRGDDTAFVNADNVGQGPHSYELGVDARATEP